MHSFESNHELGVANATLYCLICINAIYMSVCLSWKKFLCVCIWKKFPASVYLIKNTVKNITVNHNFTVQ